jgi:hypothetical protein
MFIVAMTLAVLASVGIYALAAAATEVRTSGNERQNTQTHYLSQYGVLGAAHEMTNSMALFTVNRMRSPQTRDTNCVSLQGVPVGAPPSALECVRMGAQELGASWAIPPITPYKGPGSPPGSLGTAPKYGDFFVEFTEAMRLSMPARYSTNSNACFGLLTATSIGIARPGDPNVTPTVAGIGGEGVETQRARFIAGPLIPCPH